MYFVFVEDVSLEIVETIEEVKKYYEGKDVESGVYEFFDKNGKRLKPKFTRPNKVKKYLGIFSIVESGEFELIPDNDQTVDNIYTLLKETPYLKPNNDFKTLQDVKIYLGNEGNEVFK